VEQAPAPLQPPDSPQLAAPMLEQLACGSWPTITAPHTPSFPWPLAAAEQASHVPLQATLQHTPSAQKPVWQSLPTLHFLPLPQATPQVLLGAATPPQSTSVSVPSSTPSLQASVLKHSSENGPPQVEPSLAHVVGVQPQTRGVPPPPQVLGEVQSRLD
jgi:hypothetical protein